MRAEDYKMVAFKSGKDRAKVRPLYGNQKWFTVNGDIFVSDPCYKKDTWCTAKISHVRHGNWKAGIDFYYDAYNIDERAFMDIRVAHLYAFHEDFKEKDVADKEYHECGVDSGQLGIFDFDEYGEWKGYKYYPENSKFTEVDFERFYGFCCDATTTNDGAAMIPFGVVSSSGYGDGGYEVAAIRDSGGECIAVEIEFI